MQLNPIKALERGSGILYDLLARNGFKFSLLSSGPSSGGQFAAGDFIRGNRRLKLHFRWSLGMVTYHLGDQSIPHSDFMWSVSGKRHTSRFPGFSEDPMDAFRDLLADVADYGTDFLSGTDAEFLAHIERASTLAKDQPKLPG